MSMSKFAEILSSMSGNAPAVFLAPMAGVTDFGMRRAALDFGATAAVSEMVDCRYLGSGMHSGASRARGEGLACHIVQIAGCHPAALADTAREVEAGGADAIDINMGCPAKKVVGGLAGSGVPMTEEAGEEEAEVASSPPSVTPPSMSSAALYAARV